MSVFSVRELNRAASIRAFSLLIPCWINDPGASPGVLFFPSPQFRLEQLQLTGIVHWLILRFFNPLILHVSGDNMFGPMTANCADIIPIWPEFPAPQRTFYPRSFFENLTCCNAFHYSNNLRCAVSGNRLNQKMDVVPVSPNLKKINLKPHLDFLASWNQNPNNLGTQYFATVFGPENQVIQQHRYVVPLVDETTFAHKVKIAFLTRPANHPG